MGLPRFARPKGVEGESSPNLYVANCGPAVGLSFAAISSVFSSFGDVKGVYAADESGTRVIVSYFEESSAQSALKALDGRPCSALGGRFLHLRHSVLQSPQVQVKDSVYVATVTSELNIPGVYMFRDFVTAEEEQEMLSAVDNRPWKSLAKRRVQHYGYEFCYDTRNINTNCCLGKLPSFVRPILDRISSCPDLHDAANIVLDQLTVNEYPPGVGLSPHIDTHSAFRGHIFSLSLAGPCIMELRRYSDGEWASTTDSKVEHSDSSSNFIRKAIFLPPRSMLLLSGEGRYAWHHYIPHHKVDTVKDNMIRRASRRVSFTLRKILDSSLEYRGFLYYPQKKEGHHLDMLTDTVGT